MLAPQNSRFDLRPHPEERASAAHLRRRRARLEDGREAVLCAILRDASLRDALQDEVCGLLTNLPLLRGRPVADRRPLSSASAQLPSFGSTCLITCLPATISTRKPWRS